MSTATLTATRPALRCSANVTVLFPGLPLIGGLDAAARAGFHTVELIDPNQLEPTALARALRERERSVAGYDATTQLDCLAADLALAADRFVLAGITATGYTDLVGLGYPPTAGCVDPFAWAQAYGLERA
ncbi:MAG: hypothetical protein LH650_02735 [Chloroflexi bacterium]|nr:hypothetical protein [Chloroflexota bacterium]